MDLGLVIGVLGIFASVGLTMAASTPGEFRFVRACFWTAALGTIAAHLWWQWGNEQPLSVNRVLLAAITGAIATGGLALALDWVKRKQEQALPTAILAAPSFQGPTTADAPIAKPEVKTSEKQPDQEKVRSAEILSKLRNKYPKRIIVDVTLEFLMNLYKDKMTIEGNRAIAPYIGNWLLLSGPLGDVSGRSRVVETTVTFKREFGEPGTFMYFDDLWIDHLSVLRPKQNILALCQLRSANSASASFGNYVLD